MLFSDIMTEPGEVYNSKKTQLLSLLSDMYKSHIRTTLLEPIL